MIALEIGVVAGRGGQRERPSLGDLGHPADLQVQVVQPRRKVGAVGNGDIGSIDEVKVEAGREHQRHVARGEGKAERHAVLEIDHTQAFVVELRQVGGLEGDTFEARPSF